MPPPDPTTDGGGILGLLGRMGDPAALYQGNLADPATRQAFAGRDLLSLAGGFSEMAMPTRMPIGFGAVLGHAAAAMGPGEDAVMQARLQAAQAQEAQYQAQLIQQKVGWMKDEPGLEAAYARLDAGGGTPVLPGTIGTPTVSTVPHDPGLGWLAGWTIPPNTPTATLDPKLSGSDNLNNLAQAAIPIALPGYTVKMTSGKRPGATVAGGGGESQHAEGNAADFQIYGPDGKPIPNEGPDTTGAYGKLALTMRKIAPDNLKPWLGWGGNFSTGVTGPADLMHFDWAGDRGHRGTLAQLDQQWTAAQQAPPGGGTPGRQPIRLASAGSTAGLLNPPGGAPPPQPAPPGGTPPGLLTQGPVPPGAFAGAGATVRGSWYGNSPGWSDSSDRGNQANGAPVSAGPGIALPIAKDAPNFGGWYDVTFPNGKTLRLQQTDVGPDAKGRGIDVNSVAAEQAGYTPKTFPTDEPISVRPAAGGPQVAQAGPAVPTVAGQPPPLVTPPEPGPAVPRITQPQPQGAPVTPYGNIPGAPSPEKIALAKQIVYRRSLLGLPIPPDMAETATWDIKGAEAQREAAIKLQSTPFRPSGVLLRGFDANGQPIWMQAPAAPQTGTVYNPGTERLEIASVVPTPGGPIVRSSGIPSAPSEREKSTGKTLGEYPTEFVPGNPTVPPSAMPPGMPPPPGTVDPTKPIPSPLNATRTYQTVIPPIDQQARTPDVHTYGQSMPDWQKTSGEIADAGQKAQAAETNLNYIAKAYQMVESGTWATQKAEFDGILKSLNLPTVNNANDLAQLQIALHNNYKETLQNLKAVNSRFTGNEFKINSDAGVAAGNQPAANFSLLTQDMGMLRQLQAFANDWNHAQTLVGANGAHWVNPDSFKTAWFNQSQNKLQPMIDQAQKDVGPFRGMPGWTPPAGSSLLPQQPQPPQSQVPLTREDVEREIRRRQGG